MASRTAWKSSLLRLIGAESRSSTRNADGGVGGVRRSSGKSHHQNQSAKNAPTTCPVLHVDSSSAESRYADAPTDAASPAASTAAVALVMLPDGAVQIFPPGTTAARVMEAFPGCHVSSLKQPVLSPHARLDPDVTYLLVAEARTSGASSSRRLNHHRGARHHGRLASRGADQLSKITPEDIFAWDGDDYCDEANDIVAAVSHRRRSLDSCRPRMMTMAPSPAAFPFPRQDPADAAATAAAATGSSQRYPPSRVLSIGAATGTEAAACSPWSSSGVDVLGPAMSAAASAVAPGGGASGSGRAPSSSSSAASGLICPCTACLTDAAARHLAAMEASWRPQQQQSMSSLQLQGGGRPAPVSASCSPADVMRMAGGRGLSATHSPFANSPFAYPGGAPTNQAFPRRVSLTLPLRDPSMPATVLLTRHAISKSERERSQGGTFPDMSCPAFDSPHGGGGYQPVAPSARAGSPAVDVHFRPRHAFSSQFLEPVSAAFLRNSPFQLSLSERDEGGARPHKSPSSSSLSKNSGNGMLVYASGATAAPVTSAAAHAGGLSSPTAERAGMIIAPESPPEGSGAIWTPSTRSTSARLSDDPICSPGSSTTLSPASHVGSFASSFSRFSSA